MKKIYLATILILTLFMTGCLTGSPFTNGNQVLGNYNEGTKGLVAEFVAQAPPETVDEQGSFDLQIRIHNQGAFDVADGVVAQIKVREPDSTKVEQITATDPLSQVYLQGRGVEEGIYGRSINFPDGEIKTFPLEKYRAQPIGGNFQTNKAIFNVEMCYPYYTYFADNICIDTNTDGTDVRRQACTAGDKTYSGGQGAPLEVVGIETKMVPRGVYLEPQFTIYVEHNEDGRVEFFGGQLYTQDLFGGNEVFTCSEPLSTDVNRFAVRAFLSDQELECSNPDDNFLRDGRAKFTCRLNQNVILASSQSYTAALEVVLTYQYRESIETETTITRSGTFEFAGPRDQFSEDDCFPWETFAAIPQGDGTVKNQCISNCRFNAQNLNVNSFTTILENRDVTLPDIVQYADCVFDSASSCRANKKLCTLEENLCAPGSYCGFPKCVDNNRRPQILDIQNPDLSTIRWFCKDRDETNDPQGTCGCADYAYYSYQSREQDCDTVPDREWTRVEASTISYSPSFQTSIPQQGINKDWALCLKVVDRLDPDGLFRTKKVRYPYNGFSR